MEGSRQRRMPGSRVRLAQCRICDDPIPRGSRAYCSDRCATEGRVRRSPEFAADLFRFKFGTRCASCGADEGLWRKAWEAASEALREVGIVYLLSAFPTFQLDHIRPVADGGGSCGLENYRLLCRPCHAGVTRRWQRERGQRRKSPGPYSATARQRRGYRVMLLPFTQQGGSG